MKPGVSKGSCRSALVAGLTLCLIASIAVLPGHSPAGGLEQSAAAGAAYVKRVNAGGLAYSDSTGRKWARDHPFSTRRGWGHVGGSARRRSGAVAGTRDDALYRSTRSGAFTYRFKVPDGAYVVRLKFAELSTSHFEVGRRVFDVLAEGRTQLGNLDVYAEAGPRRALDKQFRVSVDDGKLNLKFAPLIGDAMVAGIRVATEGVGPAGIALAVSPSSQVLGLGTNTSFTAEVSYLNGFGDTDVHLSVSGLPAGVSGSFSPNPLTHAASSVLELTSGADVAPGEYRATVTATAGQRTLSQGITVVVTATPDFRLTVSPTTQTVVRGNPALFQIGVTPINGFAEPVTLSATGLSSGAAAAFDPNPVDGAGPVSLTVSTSGSSPLGPDAFTIRGSGGDLQRTISATVRVNSSASTWSVSQIGTTGFANNSVIVGPGRSDGVNRVYVGTYQGGRVREFSWNGSSWAGPVDIGGYGREIHNMGMGPGRNDGVTRIYACSSDGPLLELSYSGSSWTQTTVGTSAGDCTHAAVGIGRNDGIQRLYATRGTGVYEYTWAGSSWNVVQVGSVAVGRVHGLALGRGRNDALNRLYVASTQSGTFEAEFVNGSWRMSPMGDAGDIRNVGVGAGRNDGTMRVYAATRTGYIREFTRTGTGWSMATINDSVGVMVHAYVIDGRNDDVARVYGAAGDGKAYEYTWNGSSWTAANLGGGSEYLYGFYPAPTRDGRNRLYGASFGGQVYEYST